MYNFYYEMTKKDLIEYLKSIVSHMSVFSDEAYSYITVRGLCRVFKGKISENSENVRLSGTFGYALWIKALFFGIIAALVAGNIFAANKIGFEKVELPFAAAYVPVAVVAAVMLSLREKQDGVLVETFSEKASRVEYTDEKKGIEQILKPNWFTLFNGSGVCITKQEQEMYENGEMAPMAYTYLMKLTYYWFLADTDEERERCRSLAECFRKNGYKTTGGCFPKVDEGIEFMPAKPENELTEEEHYFRNRLNIQFPWELFSKLQERLPDELKWSKLSFFNSLFHKFDFRKKKYRAQGNNRKYVSACGHFEIVFTKENYLVNMSLHNTYMGTYNFYTYKNPGEHKRFDVVPWSLWGTVDEDDDIGI